jgi:hypothetical protein
LDEARAAPDGALGGALLVTTTDRVKKQVAVAMDADGDFVGAWQSLFQDGSD